MIYKLNSDVSLNNCVSDVISDYQPSLFKYENRKSAKELRVLSLFSGCGGMDIGFEGGFICHRKSVNQEKDWIEHEINNDWVRLRKNRFKTIFANDILKEALLSWENYMSRYNIGSDTFYFQSIVELVKLHKIGAFSFPEDVDVVTGGFPCQDFSVAGKRLGFESKKMHDGTIRETEASSEETRGKLYYWMKQVIDIVKPKMFIAENVKGLVNLGNVKDIIQRDFSEAGEKGYIVLPPQVLDAGNYGVPETRERVIFIGIRKSALNEKALKILESDNIPQEYSPYPMPTHNHSANDNTLLPPVVCRDVFKGIKEPEDSGDLSQKFYSKAKYMGKHCQGQSEINLDRLAPTIRSEHHGNIEYRRLSTMHGGQNEEELNQGLSERRLTPRECALIQTFPPDYPFVTYKRGTKAFRVSPSGAYKVIGNAVPPVLAYNIAKRIEDIWSLYFG